MCSITSVNTCYGSKKTNRWIDSTKYVNRRFEFCWTCVLTCFDIFFKNRRTDFNSKTWKYYEQQIWTKKIEHRKRLVTNSRNATLFYRQVKWLELIFEQEMWIDYNMSFDWKVMAYGYDLLFFFEHLMWIKLKNFLLQPFLFYQY